MSLTAVGGEQELQLTIGFRPTPNFSVEGMIRKTFDTLEPQTGEVGFRVNDLWQQEHRKQKGVRAESEGRKSKTMFFFIYILAKTIQ